MLHRDLGFGGFFEEDVLRSDLDRSSLKASGATSKNGQLPPSVLEYFARKLNTSVSSLSEGKGFLNKPDGAYQGVPAGFTYLFQLAAHDVLQSSRMSHPFESRGPGPANLRREPLVLETIFGGGPMACPFAYEQPKSEPHDDPAESGGINRLRLGYFRDVDRKIKTRHGPPHDLPRARFNSDGPEHPDAPYTEALIPDARNDANNILAQLTVVFHRLYNALISQTGQLKTGDTSLLPPRHRTRIARLATIRIYHRILREDLLPRLLHPDVLSRYDRADPQPLLGLTETQAAGHFAFAARAAHSMVRNKYTLRDKVTVDLARIIRTSSSHWPGELPTPHNWMIDWSLFFPTQGAGDDKTNWSIKIGPHIAPDMTGDAAAEKVEPTLPSGTPIRDILAEFHTRLLSVEELWSRLAPDFEGSIPEAIESAVAAGFDHLGIDEASAKDSDGNPLDLGPLRKAPPLHTFLLFEAINQQHGGRCFGPLGSAIIGDCFLPVLKDSGTQTIDEDIAASLERMVFPGQPIASMSELLTRLPTP